MSKESEENRKPFNRLVTWVKRYFKGAWDEFIRQPLVHLLNYLIVVLFGTLVLAIWDLVSFSPVIFIHWLIENPRDFLSFLGLAILPVTVIRTFGVIAIRRRRVTIRNERILRAMGFVDCFDPRFDRKDAQWAHFFQYWEKNLPSKIKIMTTTGWNTFAKEKSGIREVLDQFRGDLEILIVDVDSEGATKRIEEIATDINGKLDPSKQASMKATFEMQVIKTIAFCTDLSNKPKNRLNSIEVKKYQEKPIWKIVLANELYAWVQHYEVGKHIDDTPIYVFSHHNQPGETTFFYAYQSAFQRRWDDPTTISVLKRH